jgi:hypothetical protein
MRSFDHALGEYEVDDKDEDNPNCNESLVGKLVIGSLGTALEKTPGFLPVLRVECGLCSSRQYSAMSWVYLGARSLFCAIPGSVVEQPLTLSSRKASLAYKVSNS